MNFFLYTVFFLSIFCIIFAVVTTKILSSFGDDNIGYIGYKYNDCNHSNSPIYYCADCFTPQLAKAKFCDYNKCQLPIMNGDYFAYHEACRYEKCMVQCCPCCCSICGYIKVLTISSENRYNENRNDFWTFLRQDFGKLMLFSVKNLVEKNRMQDTKQASSASSNKQRSNMQLVLLFGGFLDEH